jgi:hypothetical protein
VEKGRLEVLLWEALFGTAYPRGGKIRGGNREGPRRMLDLEMGIPSEWKENRC